MTGFAGRVRLGLDVCIDDLALDLVFFSLFFPWACSCARLAPEKWQNIIRARFHLWMIPFPIMSCSKLLSPLHQIMQRCVLRSFDRSVFSCWWRSTFPPEPGLPLSVPLTLVIHLNCSVGNRRILEHVNKLAWAEASCRAAVKRSHRSSSGAS